MASLARSLALLVVFIAGIDACGGATHGEAAPKPDPTYRPGQSIAGSRLCSCTECFRASCCTGDPGVDDSEPSDQTELGMSVAVCGRCTRRVWTARAQEACIDRAPDACCAGSIRE